MNTGVQLYNGNLSIISKPSPKISLPNDVLLKVSHSGVCGTDLSIIDGKFPASNKMILGHEFSGIVTELGKNVKHLHIGDRVCVNPYDYCSMCHYCVRGQPQFCINYAMKTALGYRKDGGWQEYIVVSGHLCFALPSTMPLKQSVFCQPLSTILRGWDNMGIIDQDAKILVAGAGIIGLLWASLFHYHGYRDVTISEPSEHRKEMAARLDLGFNAVHPNSLIEEWEANKNDVDETWGYDVIIDCTGNKKAVEAEFKWLRKGSVFVLFGVCGKGVEVNFEPYEIYQKEIKVVSSYLNRYSYARTVQLVHNMSERYLDFNKLDVGIFSLHDYEAALQALRNGSISKAVFQF